MRILKRLATFINDLKERVDCQYLSRDGIVAYEIRRTMALGKSDNVVYDAKADTYKATFTHYDKVCSVTSKVWDGLPYEFYATVKFKSNRNEYVLSGSELYLTIGTAGVANIMASLKVAVNRKNAIITNR